MKKNFLYLCLVCVIMAVLLTGCNNKEGGSEPEESALSKAAAAEISDFIIENMESEDELNKLDTEFIYELYGIKEEQIDESALYTGTYSAEEIAVFRAKEGQAEAIKEACEARVELQKNIFKDYRPAEMDKLSKPYIKVDGKVVILVICNDTEPVAKALENYNK